MQWKLRYCLSPTCLHTSTSHIDFTHRLHISPSHVVFTHHLHTSSSHIDFTHRLHTSPSHVAVTHRLHTSPSHIVFTRHLHTSSSHIIFTHCLHTSSSHIIFTHRLHPHSHEQTCFIGEAIPVSLSAMSKKTIPAHQQPQRACRQNQEGTGGRKRWTSAKRWPLDYALCTITSRQTESSPPHPGRKGKWKTKKEPKIPSESSPQA